MSKETKKPEPKKRRKDKASEAHKRRYTKLTADQREERLVQIGELLLDGKKQIEIAEILGISAQQVSIEVGRVRAWRAKKLTVINEELRAESMSEIQWVQRQAKAAWLDSRTDRTKVERVFEGVDLKKIAEDSDDTTLSKGAKKMTKKIVEMIGHGDPSYLNIILTAEEKKIKMLGYALPAELAKDKDGNAVANISLVINGSNIMPITDESDDQY